MGQIGAAHPDGYRQVELNEALAHRHWLVMVDVRDDNEVHDRIPKSTAVPMARLVAEVGAWKKDTPILLVSEHGRRSAQAAATLRKLGFEQVYSLNGGLERWRARGMPLESVEDDFVSGDVEVGEPTEDDDSE